MEEEVTAAQTAAETTVWSWDQILTTLRNWLTTTGIKILVSILILFITFRIINWFARRIERRYEKSKRKEKVDKTVYRVTAYVFKIVLKVLVVMGIIGYLGFDTSGLTAVIASLGVGVGLAVNGALSNMAGGVLLIFTRPFRVDDFVEACGYAGTVEDIHLCHTKLRTPDNKTVFVPNGTLATSTVVNFSMKSTRRVDFVFSVAYGTDRTKVTDAILKVCAEHALVLSDPAPTVRLSANSTSSMDYTTRVWVKKDDYWTVYFDLIEQVKAAFDSNGIQIPFQQMDVHIKND